MHKILVITGLAGLVAAILVGIGEYLLHYDSLARFSEGGYEFMKGISDSRTTTGHFFGVLGATLYPIGMYHIYLMLASISALMQIPATPEITHLIGLYELRYETLLNIIRVTTLALSVIIIYLGLSGRSHYPRWIAIFSPILLLVSNFILFAVAPEIGKHTMPIALNVAFFIFFLLSLLCALQVKTGAGNNHNPATP